MSPMDEIRSSGHLGEIKGIADSICFLIKKSTQSKEMACALQGVIGELEHDLYVRYPFLKGYSVTAISSALSHVASREDAFAFDLIEKGVCVKRYTNIDPRTLRIRNGKVVFGHKFEVGEPRYKMTADTFLRACENL